MATSTILPSKLLALNDTIIYTGGPIYTMNQAGDVVEAVAVAQGKILATGSLETVKKIAGSMARVIDLKGKALFPGFIDGHSHFAKTGYYELYWVNLNIPPLGSVVGIADLVALLKEKSKTTPKGEWIIGYNYNDLGMKEQRHPVRLELDSVSKEHPIFIRHVSGHLAAVNSKALELAKITENSPNPDGGKYRRDAEGKLDGVLEGPPAYAPLIALQPQETVEKQLDSIRHQSHAYAKAGVTLAQNGGSPTWDDSFQKAVDNGDLKIRLVIWPNGQNKDVIKSYGSKRSGDPLEDTGKIWLGAAKLFADGSPQGYTAHFSEPYFKQLPDKPADYRGFPMYRSREDFFALVKSLHDDNWQIATHTNGDQAIQDMIEAYGAALKDTPRKDHRHVLNHCQFTRPDQVSQIAELGLFPSFFVTHTWFWGDIHRETVAGPERAAHISPLKAAVDHRITFTLHNDTPVTPISPLMDVFSAVTRLTLSGKVLGPDQRVDVMTALRAITIDAAKMYFMEDKVGSLETGKFADMVILYEDPTKVPVEQIKDITIAETIVGGKSVYTG